MNEEDKRIHALTEQFLTLENFFAQTEGKIPKFPVGHAITKIKLQAEVLNEAKKVLEWHLKNCIAVEREDDWAKKALAALKELE